jgi:putative ABC transport system permease protein
MNQLLERSVAKRRFSLAMLGIFALTAMVLASVGIYGVISYTVAQGTREIGLRMALGAQQRDVLKLVVGRGLVLTLLGIVSGIAGAFALTRLMTGLLFGVTPTDATTFATVSASLVIVSLLACYIPARRATKVDPLVALRYE